SRAREGQSMLFRVMEGFKNRDAKPIYRRLRDEGRSMPEGLKYVGSWIETNFDRCFQLMECEDARLFQIWTARWSDLMEFEIVPVVPSAATRQAIQPLLCAIAACHFPPAAAAPARCRRVSPPTRAAA